jgi:hypothetical protein
MYSYWSSTDKTVIYANPPPPPSINGAVTDTHVGIEEFIKIQVTNKLPIEVYFSMNRQNRD